MSLSEALSVPGGSDGKASAYNAGDPGPIPELGRSPREGMATHFSIHAWKTPWTEEPWGLQSMGSQTVGHDRVTSRSLFLFTLSYVNKTATQKLLSDKDLSLVPKLNHLLRRSRIRHHSP